MKIFDSNLLKYMTFFESSFGISADYCAKYNNNLIFIVKPSFKIIENKKIEKISSLLRKKIRIVSWNPDIATFIKEIVKINFKKIVKNGDEIIIYASPQSRAFLIGRNASRKEELLKILEACFDIKKLRILHG